jgi:hypothetical protein
MRIEPGMDDQTDLTSCSARIGVSEVLFFADFDLTWSGDQPVERDVVLIRTSVDVVLLLWLAEGPDGMYKRVGIWSPKSGEGTSTGDIWELEGQKKGRHYRVVTLTLQARCGCT